MSRALPALSAGLLTLFFDAMKGYLAVALAARWSGFNMRWMMAAAVAAVFGHIFSFWLGFHGGKGVATGLGVFLPICAPAVGVAIVLWLIVVAFWRYSSLGSIVAAAALPIFVYVLYAPGHAPPPYVTVPHHTYLPAGTGQASGQHRAPDRRHGASPRLSSLNSSSRLSP